MIEHLVLDNFRNYSHTEFNFAKTTVIIGDNGSGKTNILEAISMLSLTTSWRAEKDSEVVKWEAPFSRITSGLMELVIQSSPYLKRMRIDGVSKRTQQVIGLFPTILFQPDDMQLLYGSPHFRRQYLDRVISQTSHAYIKAVLELQQVLKQRNRLLKHIQEGLASDDQLPFWDGQLAALQEIIQAERLAFITFLQKEIPPVFEDMVPGSQPISLHYLKSPHITEHSFYDHLQKNRMKEIAAGLTLYGPHREDISVRWGEHLVEQSMSRGQARSLLIAFKIAELAFITSKSEIRPVLLLDDIFSELDAERRHRLFEVFGDYQVIMTTTELGSIKKDLGDDVLVIELQNNS